MEYLKGPTLATYLRHVHQRKKRLPFDQVARLLRGLTTALDYAHGQGVIHRDIKPGNIMLHTETDEIPLEKTLPNDVEAIVTDFGLVRILRAASQTASGLISGTPAYMSPEQARGAQTDHRTDIYSLGAVLYEMLAGRVPFDADNTVTILHMQIHTVPPPIPGIPAKVQAVIDRALQKNPDDRYQTSQEMAIDFYLSIGMTAQAEVIRGPHPASSAPMEVPIEAPVVWPPTPKPKLPEVEPIPKSESKPARSLAWISLGVFSLVLLCLLAAWAFGLPPFGRNIPPPTATANLLIPSATGRLPTEPLLPLPTNMVQLFAGTYEVGRDPADNYHAAVQKIQLDSFWIDQYQATNADYQQYLAKTGATIPLIWPPKPGHEKHPVRGVTWDQADAYCKWEDKRLPTEAEWEAAGRGRDAFLYPWGNEPTAEGQTVNLPGQDTYEVGTQAFNKSPFEVFDMVGNVWEWVGNPYPNSNIPEGKRILHGSNFGNDIFDLAFRVIIAPDDAGYIYDVGFRCAASQVK
jgi:formylglycine-generating enzyme required for sulfatase activity